VRTKWPDSNCRRQTATTRFPKLSISHVMSARSTHVDVGLGRRRQHSARRHDARVSPDVESWRRQDDATAHGPRPRAQARFCGSACAPSTVLGSSRRPGPTRIVATSTFATVCIGSGEVGTHTRRHPTGLPAPHRILGWVPLSGESPHAPYPTVGSVGPTSTRAHISTKMVLR